MRMLQIIAAIGLACAILSLSVETVEGVNSSGDHINSNNASLHLDHTNQNYLTDVTIGSDNQTVPLIFDTGLPITRVNPDCSKISNDTGYSEQTCLSHPRYNPLTSTTAKILDQSLNNTYGQGGVLGTYFTDEIRVGSLVAKNQSFGVAAVSFDFETGIFGAGRRPDGYPSTFIETLAAQGQINSYAFSLDLRSVNETGSVIFGGLDTGKYKCKLSKAPTLSDYTFLTELGMTLPNKTTITFDPSKWRGNATRGLPFILDAGTPTNLLPRFLYFAIGSVYPDARPYKSPYGWTAYEFPCNAPPGSFDYTFGDVTIKVPLQDSLYKDVDGTCSFGFSLPPPPEWHVPPILAQPFMRGTYIVFDHDNEEKWFDESADCGSNVAPIGKGKDAVPVVSGCGCDALSTTTSAYYSPPTPTIMKREEYIS